MKPSLSVLVPVYNAQGSVERLVTQLLEVLPELTPRFDVLIIDDGSTDATGEVARDVALRYPQISVATHQAQRGPTAAWRTGLARTRGEFVLMCDHECPANLYDIPKLWRPSAAREVILAWPSGRAAQGRVPRLPSTRGPLLAGPRPSLQLIRRSLIGGWKPKDDSDDLLAYLVRKGYPTVEIELRDRRSAHEAERLAGALATDAAHGPGETKRPNYLARSNSFAQGL